MRSVGHWSRPYQVLGQCTGVESCCNQPADRTRGRGDCKLVWVITGPSLQCVCHLPLHSADVSVDLHGAPEPSSGCLTLETVPRPEFAVTSEAGGCGLASCSSGTWSCWCLSHVRKYCGKRPLDERVAFSAQFLAERNICHPDEYLAM